SHIASNAEGHSVTGAGSSPGRASAGLPRQHDTWAMDATRIVRPGQGAHYRTNADSCHRGSSRGQDYAPSTPGASKFTQIHTPRPSSLTDMSVTGQGQGTTALRDGTTNPGPS
ncbi:MAG: hypothetical protein ACRDXB_02130, partial [Actinomycetes bacterium]